MEIKTKPKIFIHSWLSDDLLSKLKNNFDIDHHDTKESILTGKDLLDRVLDVEGILVQSSPIDKKLIESCPNLKIVSNVGVGFDNIDAKLCTKMGIQVTNTPGILNDAVADMSMALLLAVARRVPEGDQIVRSGGFKANFYHLLWGADLKGENLGIIGMGSIGKDVAKRALPFGLNIKYHNRNRLSKDIERSLNAEWMSLLDLLKSCRFIIILCPLTNETKHLITIKELKNMKRDSFLINIARGPIVKESDLIIALEDKFISGCALDVYEFEPNYDIRLARMDNVVLAPHAGSASVKARKGMVELAAKNIEMFFLEKDVLNPVNTIN
ncbi:MAG: D-glycerate dehydrogenase [Pelagibacterales bacterium]|nr:D-glycerate dehydrogenase [Pelagibacterales bacterium]PPR15846.1 MAG: Glyoxylate/hydroxypyruvate reductase B [Alphaproteobacteria bacterium MarineAlpha9_Bin3]